METMHEDVTEVAVDGKTVLLVGTAHISQQSVETVRDIIATRKPDTVCIELDADRMRSLRERQRWESLDLKQIIRSGQFMFLMANLALSSFQKRMGSYTGVKPGAEMLAAVESAEEHGAKVVLCDRNVRTTLLRAWRMTPWWRRSMLFSSLLMGMFERTEVSEEELAKLRQQHNISSILEELGEVMPDVKGVLVDERDRFMSHAIRTAPGDTIVAVVGAAHKPGILRLLEQPADAQAAQAVDVVPEKSALSKLTPWLLPAALVGLFIWGFMRVELDVVQDTLFAWLALNCSGAALGALVGLGHPLTILAAFIGAPFATLHPAVGIGMIAAFVQVMMVPPTVRDMESFGDDVAKLRGVWANRLGRVMVVFVLSNLGGMLGNLIALKWLKNLV
jgi:pheromone shutdown-related protein TraB